jgi:hypothetical protein
MRSSAPPKPSSLAPSAAHFEPSCAMRGLRQHSVDARKRAAGYEPLAIPGKALVRDVPNRHRTVSARSATARSSGTPTCCASCSSAAPRSKHRRAMRCGCARFTARPPTRIRTRPSRSRAACSTLVPTRMPPSEPALHEAALNGNLALLELLLERGADPAIRERSGREPARARTFQRARRRGAPARVGRELTEAGPTMTESLVRPRRCCSSGSASR